ncbi:hypothetical protein BHM03_00056837, partial [Ensete ventricosum]
LTTTVKGRTNRCWAGVKFEHRVKVRTMQYELAESSLEVGRGPDDVVGSSPRTHQKFARKFVGSSPTGYRELTECSLKECWKFVGSSSKEIKSLLRTHQKFARKFIGSSLTGCRELAESSLEEY